jgi:hypothetical protein
MEARIRVAVVAGLALLVASTASAQQWGRDSLPRDGACFYKDPNFHGDYFCARAGETFSSVPSGMNDRISSIRIFGRAEVMVFRDVRFDGRSSRFDFDIKNLKDEGWNDLISSIRVRSRSGGGGFGGGRPADPDRIVRRAYQDILDREPDTAGLRLYRSHILDDGWSEEDVREAIRKSPEYREKSTMTIAKAQDIVRRAYMNVLKREPDSGSRGYVDKVMRDHWSQQDVERELRKSPEYRTKG